MAYIKINESMFDDAFASIQILENKMKIVVERNNFLESEIDNIIHGHNQLVKKHNKLNELVNKIISDYNHHLKVIDEVVKLYDNKFMSINTDIDNIFEFINNSDS